MTLKKLVDINVCEFLFSCHMQYSCYNNGKKNCDRGGLRLN